MSKLFNDVKRMSYYINVIEQYNNFRQLGIEDDINYLKKRIEELYKITDSNILIENFKWCANMVNQYYNEIDSEFKKLMFKEENNRMTEF